MGFYFENGKDLADNFDIDSDDAILEYDYTQEEEEETSVPREFNNALFEHLREREVILKEAVWFLEGEVEEWTEVGNWKMAGRDREKLRMAQEDLEEVQRELAAM